ncbi:MAG: MFS transporter [Desulfobacterales bacterium]|nr:MAG: MFS transporter [Desulfobacterales bacterium]
MKSPSQNNRSFLALGAMDVIARTGYQMGKSPVLPVLALAVGAGSAELGLIAGASVATGVVLKPWIGALSDRIGRRPLLLTAGALFALVPWCYVFVDGVHSLMVVRILHGLATAVCGPIMAALVADLYADRGQGCIRYGWYDTFRSVGYVSGPFLGGMALKVFADPRQIYFAVGMFGIGAAAAALFIAPPRTLTKSNAAARSQRSMAAIVVHYVRTLTGNSYLRGIVGIELIANMMTRWTKVFWVVWAVERFDLVFIGSLLSLMFATSLCVKPLAGWLGSRTTARTVLSSGAILLASGVVGLYHTQSPAGCLFWAMILGIGDGLVMPSVMALIAYAVDSNHRGAAFGVLGSYRNIGKATGPALGGFLVSTFGSPWTAVAAACLLMILAGRLLWHHDERRTIDRPMDSATVG